MEYTGDKAIDAYRAMVEKHAELTLDKRLTEVLVHIDIDDKHIQNVLNNYTATNCVTWRRPVEFTPSEIIRLLMSIVINQEQRIRKLENRTNDLATG